MQQATGDVIQPAPDKLLNGGLVVNPECKPHDLMNDIDAKLYQLDAALTITHGAGGEVFRGWSDDLQEAYMWGLRESLAQINALWQRYSDVMRHETFAKQ